VLSRASAPDGAYDYLNVGVAPQDADGVLLLGGALNLDADGNGSNERQLLATTKLRYGRLRLANAFGSEMMTLAMPMMAEYFISGGFRKNYDDNCTTAPTSNITFSEYTRQLTAGAVSALTRTPMAWGDAGLRLLAPGLGHQGSVRVTASTPVWLQYPWTGASASDPSAMGTFGIHHGPDGIIFMREMY